MKVLVVMYNEIGLFPPTLNAVELTAEKVQKVITVELITHQTEIVYNQSNIETNYISYVPGSRLNSVWLFYLFLKTIHQVVQKEKPEFVIVYDSMAAMAIQLSSLFRPNQSTYWYHSHDVIDRKELSRFSLLQVSVWFQKRMVRRCKVFSLPAEERKQYYPLKDYKGKFICIPNYPSKRYYASHTVNQDDSQIRMIYQGRITVHRGLEEMIRLMPNKVNGKEIRLVIKGIIDTTYKQTLDSLIKKHHAEDFVEFHALTSYQSVPAFTSQSHIGLAIFMGHDIMNTTLGTASNKVYEYTACGMPFLYFSNEHFDHYFREMPWAVPTDVSPESLLKNILYIDQHYQEISSMAKKDFLAHRNYEAVFLPVLNYFLFQKFPTKRTNE